MTRGTAALPPSGIGYTFARSTMPPSTVSPPDQSVLSGQIIGRFRLQERLGEGGMGVVYRAVRTGEVQQAVAVKLVSSVFTDGVQRRFEREVQFLARLEHPAIARLVDAGIRDHRPWFAMEFVQGERIDTFCDARDFDHRAIVGLLIELTDAIAAAHRLLIVHSDIKPSNVLVTADGRPKLIDFGISTAVREADALRPETVHAGRLFSPGYAAPEQINDEPITVATDVFGLGALAYRLLTGVTPYSDSTRSLDYLLALGRHELAPPSRIARETGGRTRADAAHLQGDLDAILGKALDRDPARRYASAGDLKADLAAYLDQRPVLARAPSRAYRAGKFLKRNALASTVGALALIGALAAAAVLGRQDHLLALERDAARSSASRAQRVSDFLVSMLQAADPQLGGRRDVTVADVLDAGAAQTRIGLADDPRIRAQMLVTIAQTDFTLGRFAAGLAAVTDAVALLEEEANAGASLAHALELKGRLLRGIGDRSGAATALRAAIDRFGTVPGSDRERAAAMQYLGMVLAPEPDPAPSEQLYRDAVAIYRRLGTDDADYGDLLISLGEALQRTGHFEESLAVEREGHAMMLRHQAADNPDVMGGEIAIAEALQSLGRYAEAETVHRDLLAARQRVLGPEHIDTLISALSLSANLRMQHRYEEAIPLARTTAQHLEAIVGEDHPTRLFALSMEGLADCAGGDARRGLAAIEQAAAIRSAHFGAADRRAVLGRVLVAVCLRHVQRADEAARVFAAETTWRRLASGSYSDLPELVEGALH